MSISDRELTRPEVSNRLFAPFIRFLEREWGSAFVHACLDEAGLPRDYLLSTEDWVSHAYLRRFNDILAARRAGLAQPPPHDHEVWQWWRRAGQNAMNPDELGPIIIVVRALGTPRRLYQFLTMTKRTNTTVTLKITHLGPGRLLCEAGPAADRFEFDIGNCWSLQGNLEAVPTVWGSPLADVRHIQCRHDRAAPSATCQYDVRYQNQPRRWQETLEVAAGATAAAGIASALAAPVLPWTLAAAGSTLALTRTVTFARRKREHLRLVAALESALDRTDERSQRLFDEGLALHRADLASRKLSGYLASELVERIFQDPDIELTLGGQRVVAAVLFVDIVGFTSRCESLTPERVVDDLNLYFGHVDPVIVAHRGVIDKRVGDAVMVVFTPRSDETPDSHRRRALRCALEILCAVDRCALELVASGAAPMEARVGLSYGPLVQGNMGSEHRMEYTVIGDVVNVAARLEGRATPGRVLAQSALLGEDCPGRIVSRRSIQVRGKHEPMDVVELEPCPRH